MVPRWLSTISYLMHVCGIIANYFTRDKDELENGGTPVACSKLNLYHKGTLDSL